MLKVYSNLTDEQNKYLIELENKCKIKLFKKKNDCVILRDNLIIIEECNRMKKKILLDCAHDIKSFANQQYIDLNKFIEIQENIKNELVELDTIINMINYNINNERFIEIYEN
jgi:hypothetical protein